LIIFGKKRITPTIIERMAAKRTAAAETFLAILAFSDISGLTRSTRASSPVLISSRMRTKLMVNKRMSHSIVDKPNIIAKIIIDKANTI